MVLSHIQLAFQQPLLLPYIKSFLLQLDTGGLTITLPSSPPDTGDDDDVPLAALEPVQSVHHIVA